MNTSFIKTLCFVTLASLVTTNTNAQTSKGQVGDHVEIFGRARAERVDEGEVVYKFTKGYSVKFDMNTDYFYRHQDPLAWHLYIRPNFDINDLGTSAEVKSVETNKDEKFTNLNQTYLYSEFNAPEDATYFLLSSGNTRTFINGLPYEADHYDFAYTLVPFTAKKGINQFIFTSGRYGTVEASIISPEKAIMLTKKDFTSPDIIIGEDNEKWGAIRVLNASNTKLKGLSIECELVSGEKAIYKTNDALDMTTTKLPYLIPAVKSKEAKNINALITLKDAKGKIIDTISMTYRIVTPTEVHERTFVSKVDGSVQYYSVRPSTSTATSQALFLSVHGAGVEARNQARAYASKDNGYIICPTNRRPFGFNWEDIGRIDAIEVLEDARRIFKTDPLKTYLTGHSMGGHGSWYLGATYPDRFAAIAPCASYPDIIDYVGDKDKPTDFNATKKMIERAAHAGRVKNLKRNYLQSGIYILHGDADKVVPIDMVREMRQILAKFHPNVSYYEYPGGSHWYGDESVDWKPIFDFYKWQTIPATNTVKHIEFVTANPSVSASNYWATIVQQELSLEYSSIILDVQSDSLIGTTDNVSILKLDIDNMPIKGRIHLEIDGTKLTLNDAQGEIILRKENNVWANSSIKQGEKTYIRTGGFKEVFNHNVVFVYATNGSTLENEWYKNKAKFDASTMLYRANGKVDVISDKEFLADNNTYKDRNVVIYGNADNNAAWKSTLAHSPVIVKNGKLIFGEDTVEDKELGVYFVYPRYKNAKNLIAVVGGTGIKGAYATYPNDYLLANTGFADLSIIEFDGLKSGIKGLMVTGFFGQDWSIKNGNFVIK